MTYLPQNYQNTTSLLTFFLVDDEGFLIDGNIVEFRIKDESGNAHTPQAGWIEVTTNGRFDLGSYYAIQECDNEGWTVPSTATEGTWSIHWRWKVDASDAYQTWSMSFDVVAKRDETADTGYFGIPYRAIVSPAEIRRHGLTVANATDRRLEELIVEAQSYLELACRQMFRPEVQTLRIQGNESDRLMINLPIIGIDFVKYNRSTSNATRSALAVDFARVDKVVPMVLKPDPRRNPTISFRRWDTIFSTTYPMGRGKFSTGRLNQLVKGVFGFLETNGTVPLLVKKAATLLVYNTAVAFKVGAVPVPAGPMTSKTVDRHSVSFANTGAASVSSALAKTKEIQEIVRAYRGPLSLASPDPQVTYTRLV